MTSVIGAFTTKAQDFPAGSNIGAKYVLTLTDSNGGAVLTGQGALTDTNITIANVPPGTYTGTIALVDANGNSLATEVAASAPITVIAPATVTLGVPDSLSLSAQ